MEGNGLFSTKRVCRLQLAIKSEKETMSYEEVGRCSIVSVFAEARLTEARNVFNGDFGHDLKGNTAM